MRNTTSAGVGLVSRQLKIWFRTTDSGAGYKAHHVLLPKPTQLISIHTALGVLVAGSKLQLGMYVAFGNGNNTRAFGNDTDRQCPAPSLE